MSLCRQGNMYVTRAKVEGTICVVCDDSDVIVAHITESFFGNIESGNIGSSDKMTSGNPINAISWNRDMRDSISRAPKLSPISSTTPSNFCSRNSSMENVVSLDAGSNRSDSGKIPPGGFSYGQPNPGKLHYDDKQSDNVMTSPGQVPNKGMFAESPYHQRNHQKAPTTPYTRKLSSSSPPEQFSPKSTAIDGVSQQYHYKQMSLSALQPDTGNARKVRIPQQAMDKHSYGMSSTMDHRSARRNTMELTIPQRTNVNINGFEYVNSYSNDSQLSTAFSIFHGRWDNPGPEGTIPNGHPPLEPLTNTQVVNQTSRNIQALAPEAMTSQTVVPPYLNMDNFYCRQGETVLDDYRTGTSNGRPCTNGSAPGHKCPYCEGTYPTSTKLWKHIRNENCSSKPTLEKDTHEMLTSNQVSLPGDYTEGLDYPRKPNGREYTHKKDVSDGERQKSMIDLHILPSYQQALLSNSDPTVVKRLHAHADDYSEQNANGVAEGQSPALEVRVKIESCDNELNTSEESCMEYNESECILMQDSAQAQSNCNRKGYADSNNNNDINDNNPITEGNLTCTSKENESAEDNLRDVPEDHVKAAMMTSKYYRNKIMFRPSLSKSFRKWCHHPKKRLSLLRIGHQKTVQARQNHNEQDLDQSV